MAVICLCAACLQLFIFTVTPHVNNLYDGWPRGWLIHLVAVLAEHHPECQQLKRELWAMGDPHTAQDCDYDWADEAGHIRYGQSSRGT